LYSLPLPQLVQQKPSISTASLVHDFIIFIPCNRKVERTFTEGKLSGAVLELRRKALARRYPAELPSFQAPSSSLVKNSFTFSNEPASKEGSRATNAFMAFVTRALYRCLAESKYAPPAVAPPDAWVARFPKMNPLTKPKELTANLPSAPRRDKASGDS